MRTGISFTVSPADQARMEAIVADRNSRQKHVWRCRIVLLTAVGQGTAAIMREAGGEVDPVRPDTRRASTWL